MKNPALPTLREELDRKVADTLSWLIGAVANGKMTEAEFSTAIDALFMAVSGLMDDEFMAIITGSQEFAKRAVSKDVRVFTKGDRMMTLTWRPDACEVEIVSSDSPGLPSRLTADTPDAARKRQQALCERFAGAGWDVR